MNDPRAKSGRPVFVGITVAVITGICGYSFGESVGRSTVATAVTTGLRRVTNLIDTAPQGSMSSQCEGSVSKYALATDSPGVAKAIADAMCDAYAAGRNDVTVGHLAPPSSSEVTGTRGPVGQESTATMIANLENAFNTEASDERKTGGLRDQVGNTE